MIDSQGFRANVGIVLCNRHDQVLWARRFGQNAWQFPQGGIKPRETPEEAMYRELHEEVGLYPEDVEILAQTRGWLRYRLPPHMVRRHRRPVCIGQKQRWFLLRLTAPESHIRLDAMPRPEFDHWEWVDFWLPVDQVVSFKREVYRRAMTEFARHLGIPQPADVPRAQPQRS